MAYFNITEYLKAHRVESRFGAPLGAPTRQAYHGALKLQHVDLQGDYGPDGTYWGYVSGTGIWCAFNPPTEQYAEAEGTRIYVRAKNRMDATRKLLEDYPELIFVYNPK